MTKFGSQFLTVCFASAAAMLFSAVAVVADEPARRAVQVGDTVSKLAFKDIRYLPRSLDDFKGKKAFVLVFTNTTCPLVQRYWPALNRLEREYRDRGVQFLSVNVGPDDSILAVAAQAVKHEVEFPCVKDSDGQCVRAVGATRTPEVAVLDAERRLRYRGRIDDQYRLGGVRPATTRHDLREAADELLAGKEVSVPETPVDGCLITVESSARAATGPVTYAEHVGPLVQKHCGECHRPGTAAPFSLTTFEQVSSRAEAIAEVVRDQRMPPWFADPEHGTFVNRRGLTAAERETIARWVQSGKSPGDEKASRTPAASAIPAPAPEWRIGTPDLVVSTFRHDLPAEGLIDYKYRVLPHLFLEDTWVQAIEIKGDNPRVLHHCNMAYLTLGEEFRMTNFLTGTVPGGEPMTLDGGVAVLIPKGSTLGLQIHYVTTGKPETCRISVGLKYARETVQKRLRFKLIVDHKFAIPPGAPAHKVAASRMLECDALGVGLFTHMHVRGRDMTFLAHHPDGRSETLLVIPNYNFDWQMPYRWQPGTQRFPKGTRLEAVAHYDNSAFNPYNPDPTATVRDGQQTHEEMMNGFVFYVDEAERLGLDIDPKTGRVKEKTEQGR